MVSDKKIAIIGLDNAGKTSILTAMKKKFDIPKELKGLKPTLKVERSSFQFMGHVIYQNDFGGQKIYREEYLKHKDRYLTGTDLIFFVIDIQDQLRFDESIEYFKEILSYFLELKEKVPIVLTMHKIDPHIQEDPTILSNIEQIQEKIQPFINDTDIIFTQSNIYEINSIIRMFSMGISLLYEETEAIQKFIMDIVDKMENVMSLLIFEQNGIEIGSYFLEHITLSIKKKILTLYEIAQRRIIENNANTYEFSDRLDAFTKISGAIQSFKISGLEFYIMLILEEHDEAVVIDQFNFFESSSSEMHEILKTILIKDDNGLNP